MSRYRLISRVKDSGAKHQTRLVFVSCKQKDGSFMAHGFGTETGSQDTDLVCGAASMCNEQAFPDTEDERRPPHDTDIVCPICDAGFRLWATGRLDIGKVTLS